MITFENNNIFLREQIDIEDNTVSTLLIPVHLLEEFRLKTQKFDGNIGLYFRSLLRRFRTITCSGLLPEPIKIKTEYQEKKLCLQKISFRPKNEDWIELGEIASAFGKSRCWVFVYLLKLDLLGLWKLLVKAGLKKIVPTIPSSGLEGFWLLGRVSHYFARGYTIRV